MKTNPTARWIVTLRLRLVLTCLVMAILGGMELWVGGAFASRLGQTSGGGNESFQAPGLSIGDMMGALFSR